MVDRLVLGCGDLCLSLVSRLRSGDGNLLVLDRDESRVEHLRDMSISADTADITDPAAVEAAGIDPDVVVVLTDNRQQATASAYTAREVYPGAYLLALPGETGDLHQAPAVVDSVLSPGKMILDTIERRHGGERGAQLRRLRETLLDMTGTLAICTHDNPDPDALGAALALRAIADRFDVTADICYFGEIAHQENKAFVNLLDVDLRRLEDPTAIDGDHLALVDHSRPGVNDQLSPDRSVDIIIDHHPAPELPEARFLDVRTEVGATSSLLVDYLEGYDIAVPTDVATGLLYGIRVDTRDYGRETTAADFEATATLIPDADLDVLERIESPSVSPHTIDTIGRAIENRQVTDSVLMSCVGSIRERDSLAQAADRLLELESINVAIVYGYTNETIHLSGRARSNTIDLGERFRMAFDDIGSAGGHESMAGAQIPLGIFQALESTDEQAELNGIIADQIESRFDAALAESPPNP